MLKLHIETLEGASIRQLVEQLQDIRLRLAMSITKGKYPTDWYLEEVEG